jgi:hypothetical protein
VELLQTKGVLFIYFVGAAHGFVSADQEREWPRNVIYLNTFSILFSKVANITTCVQILRYRQLLEPKQCAALFRSVRKRLIIYIRIIKLSVIKLEIGLYLSYQF